MTRAQQIIKYAAIVFALLLVVAIFSGIIGAVGILARLTDDGSGETATGDMETMAIADTVTKLDIEVAAAELIIRPGETFTASENSRYITCSQSGNTLTIKESNHGWGVHDTAAGTVIVEIPWGQVFETVEITAGAGKVSVEGLVAHKEADIEGGAGEIDIRGSEFWDLELDLGVGQVTLEALVQGRSSIHFGVGEADVTLVGSADDYAVRMDKGIGAATLDGAAMQSGVTYGDGDRVLDMDGGIGAIRINFSE